MSDRGVWLFDGDSILRDYFLQKIKSICVSMLKRHITILLPECCKIISKSEELVRQFPGFTTDITSKLHKSQGCQLRFPKKVFLEFIQRDNQIIVLFH